MSVALEALGGGNSASIRVANPNGDEDTVIRAHLLWSKGTFPGTAFVTHIVLTVEYPEDKAYVPVRMLIL